MALFDINQVGFAIYGRERNLTFGCKWIHGDHVWACQNLIFAIQCVGYDAR